MKLALVEDIRSRRKQSRRDNIERNRLHKKISVRRKLYKKEEQEEYHV